jgi:cell division protein FtsL
MRGWTRFELALLVFMVAAIGAMAFAIIFNLRCPR